MNINPLMQGRGGGATKPGKMTTAFFPTGDTYTFCALKIDSAEEVIETTEVLNQGTGSHVSPIYRIIKKDGTLSAQIPTSNWAIMGYKLSVADALNAAGVSVDDAGIIIFLGRGYNYRVVVLTIS